MISVLKVKVNTVYFNISEAHFPTLLFSEQSLTLPAS